MSNKTNAATATPKPVEAEGKVTAAEEKKPWYRRLWENPKFQKWSKRAALGLSLAGASTVAYFAGKMAKEQEEPVIVYSDLPAGEAIDNPTEEMEKGS